MFMWGLYWCEADVGLPPSYWARTRPYLGHDVEFEGKVGRPGRDVGLGLQVLA